MNPEDDGDNDHVNWCALAELGRVVERRKILVTASMCSFTFRISARESDPSMRPDQSSRAGPATVSDASVAAR